MEVVMPRSPSRDFFFPSNSLYASAPASPKPFGNPSSEHYYFLSAPASPRGSSFNWEEKPEADALDFAFEFSGEAEGEAPAPADELFEGGKIRPLNCSLPQSSTKSRDESESQRGRRGDAIQMIGNSSEIISGGGGERGRGRGRAPPSASEGYSRGRRAARSLSPLRGGGGGGGEFEKSRNSAASSSASLMRGCGSRSKKWSLKDLFLFRSASDGRAIGRGSKDPLRKYTLLPSFSSSSSSSSPSSLSFTSPSKVRRNNETTAGAATSKSGKGSMASVHETHYSASRAASEEMMKKKTPLPFHRNSLFGYLRFNPAINSIGRRLNSYSLYRGRSSS